MFGQQPQLRALLWFLYFHLLNPHLEITESQNCKGWKGPSETIQSNSLLPYSGLHREASRWVLIISREGDSPQPLFA